jgi:DNA-directed RNA polymerase subunit RPC12/RpoP
MVGEHAILLYKCADCQSNFRSERRRGLICPSCGSVRLFGIVPYEPARASVRDIHTGERLYI